VAAATTQALTTPILGELELIPFSVGDDPKARGRLGAPVSAETGSAGMVVYLEVDPGDHIPLHTHTADETVVVLAGSGVASLGDRRAAITVGAVIAVPAFERHGFENTGNETLKLVGFLPTGVVGSWFDEPVAPFGTPTFVVPILE